MGTRWMVKTRPKTPGSYWRGIDVKSMPDAEHQRWINAHRKGRVVQYNGYTSAAIVEGEQYGGDWQILMHLESARDISAFSARGEREIVLPRGVQLEYRGFKGGYRIMGEIMDNRTVKKARNFAEDENEIKAWIGMGYTRERAIEILQEMAETRERWKREKAAGIVSGRALYDRMQAEVLAGMVPLEELAIKK